MTNIEGKNIITSARRGLLLAVLAIVGIMPVAAQEAAQQYFTVDEMPDLLRILPPPPDSASAQFALDVVRHMWGKTQRQDAERRATAIIDAEYSLSNLIRIFSEPFGMAISFAETPEIYRLLRDFTTTCDNICKKPKAHYMRVRPFMMFHEPTLTPDQEATMIVNGSYPSGHTIFGWCAALILSEINPEQTEDLMARGYMYGESRVIVGAHWQSDVDAGMLAASVLHTKLHTSALFLEQMAKAREEYLAKKGGSSNISSLQRKNTDADKNIYNLSGQQLPHQPSNSIYIQSGRKFVPTK